jgi:ATP-binding cassette subfamily G (WHITE) protein 2
MQYKTQHLLCILQLFPAAATLCVTVDLSAVLISLFFEISRLYGGFFTSPAQLQEFPQWRFLDAISFMKYTFVGAALNELTGKEFVCDNGLTPCPVTSGQQIIELKGYDQYTIGYCAGIIVLYVFVCRVVAYLGLKFIRY